MLSMKFYNPGPDGNFIREGPEIYPKTITAHVSLWRCRFRDGIPVELFKP